MSKIILVLTALLMTTTLFSNFAKAAINSDALTKSIMNSASKPGNQHPNSGMVYAGEDISRLGTIQAVAVG